MLKRFGVSTNENYQEDFLKVAVLNRSTKGAALQSTLFIAFYQQKASKNEMLKQFGVSTNEIYQEVFLKIPVSNRSKKGEKISSFVEHPVHSLLPLESEQK